MMVDEAHRLKNDESALYKVRVHGFASAAVSAALASDYLWLPRVSPDRPCAERGADWLSLWSLSHRPFLRNMPAHASSSCLRSSPSLHHPHQELIQWSFQNKLLVTGTPLQVRSHGSSRHSGGWFAALRCTVQPFSRRTGTPITAWAPGCAACISLQRWRGECWWCTTGWL